MPIILFHNDRQTGSSSRTRTGHENMVKSLEDYCLACIARHFTTYSRLGNYLSLRHKEVLLERMCWHEQLTLENNPSIFYNLFSHTLLRVNLSFSSQITDNALELLGNSGCLPTKIILNQCPSVTGTVGRSSLAYTHSLSPTTEKVSVSTPD